MSADANRMAARVAAAQDSDEVKSTITFASECSQACSRTRPSVPTLVQGSTSNRSLKMYRAFFFFAFPRSSLDLGTNAAYSYEHKSQKRCKLTRSFIP
eukprot:5671614-Amphidinium_carterae.2